MAGRLDLPVLPKEMWADTAIMQREGVQNRGGAQRAADSNLQGIIALSPISTVLWTIYLILWGPRFLRYKMKTMVSTSEQSTKHRV